MNYHHDPSLAAWMVHMVYCPIGQSIAPEEIARKMNIPIPDGNGQTALEEIGRRVLADPADIPAFAASLEELCGNEILSKLDKIIWESS